jgi:hypothetical protein
LASERLVFKGEDLIQLAKQLSTLSIKGQLKPTLDWLQAMIAFSDEELEKLVQMQPAVLCLRAKEQLGQRTA